MGKKVEKFVELDDLNSVDDNEYWEHLTHALRCFGDIRGANFPDYLCDENVLRDMLELETEHNAGRDSVVTYLHQKYCTMRARRERKGLLKKCLGVSRMPRKNIVG